MSWSVSFGSNTTTSPRDGSTVLIEQLVRDAFWYVYAGDAAVVVTDPENAPEGSPVTNADKNLLLQRELVRFIASVIERYRVAVGEATARATAVSAASTDAESIDITND